MNTTSITAINVNNSDCCRVLYVNCFHFLSLALFGVSVNLNPHLPLCFSSPPTVIRAKISGEKIVSPSNSSSPYMKMIQYEIKMIKVRSLDRRRSCRSRGYTSFILHAAIIALWSIWELNAHNKIEMVNKTWLAALIIRLDLLIFWRVCTQAAVTSANTHHHLTS